MDTTKPSFFDHPNWVFVTYEYAGGGHRLARKLCCLPNFFWYSTVGNGKNPWNVSSWTTLPDSSFLKNVRKIASAHFSQVGPYGMLPFDHSIGKVWIPDKSQYYRQFARQFTNAHGPNLLDSYKLVYISHAMPDELTRLFTNAKVISLVDDPVKIADRYMHTTALFPGNFPIAFKWIRDLEYTENYRKHKLIQSNFKEDYTMRDLWSYDNFQTMWNDHYREQYYSEVLNKTTRNINHRLTVKHNNVLTVNKSETKKIKDFLLG
jgi:hypothetical protein